MTKLASGQRANFDPAAWHHLPLEMKDEQISGFLDGRNMTAVADKSGAKGMAFVASTYDQNLFDNIHVSECPP